ncbi:MAG: alpha/beta hydrolase family protein [Bacillota bacterium]|nr:alpha/beta hydrolase family protein [Bacillota bacterium]
MALLELNFYSQSLFSFTSVNVLLPELYSSSDCKEHVDTGAKLQTLYLLHGLNGDHTSWTRRSSIERYAGAYQLAVVMPAVSNSFYSDMAYGSPYFTFVTEELPHVMRYYFPLSDKREDNFVAGLSMGGYGAMKWALAKPETVGAAASLSGAVDIVGLVKSYPQEYAAQTKMIMGDREIEGSCNDLFHLAHEDVKKSVSLPKLIACCGTEDFLHEGNLHFKDKLEKLGIPLEYFEEPGVHEWDFWDRNIQRILSMLPLKKRIYKIEH